MKTAHYFKGRGREIVVIVTGVSISGPDAKEIAVKGKREARKIAGEHGAKAWNF